MTDFDKIDMLFEKNMKNNSISRNFAIGLLKKHNLLYSFQSINKFCKQFYYDFEQEKIKKCLTK